MQRDCCPKQSVDKNVDKAVQNVENDMTKF